MYNVHVLLIMILSAVKTWNYWRFACTRSTASWLSALHPGTIQRAWSVAVK